MCRPSCRSPYLLTSDEEVGSPSTRDLIEAEASRHRYVLVPEPARADGGVVTGRYAIARFNLEATGRPSHAGSRLADGRSAIREMARKLIEIEDMTTDDCTFSVGVIHGGQWVNCVTTTCTGETLSMAKRQEDLDRGVARMLALSASSNDVQFKVTRGVTRPVWEPDGKVMALYDTARGIAQRPWLRHQLAEFRRRLGRQFHRCDGHRDAGWARRAGRRRAHARRAYRGGEPRLSRQADGGSARSTRLNVAVREHGMLLWSWRVVRGRPRLFIGMLCGLARRAAAAWRHQRHDARHPRLGYWRRSSSWPGSAFLFTTERLNRMAADAEAQEEGEWTVFWLTVAAVTFSFVAVIDEFSGTKELPPAQRNLHVILVAVTLLVSWLMTHTTFAFRYAHEYYEIDSGGVGIVGGLEFPGEKRPDYLDFLYFALVLGMTFQVSDVQITARKFRRLAAAHGLLSFLYNTIIVALTVNIAAGML